MKPTELEAWAAAIAALLVAIGVPARWLWGVIQKRRQRARDTKAVEAASAWEAHVSHLRAVQQERDRLLQVVAEKEAQIQELWTQRLEDRDRYEEISKMLRQALEDRRALRSYRQSTNPAENVSTRSPMPPPSSRRK